MNDGYLVCLVSQEILGKCGSAHAGEFRILLFSLSTYTSYNETNLKDMHTISLMIYDPHNVKIIEGDPINILDKLKEIHLNK